MLEPVSQIVLNAADVEVDEAWLVDGAGDRLSASITHDAVAERVRFDLDGVADAGTAFLHARFRGVLNDQLRGFYRSTSATRPVRIRCWPSPSSSRRPRRAFPCWDEPDLKAVFSITLVVSDGLTALANTRQISEEPLSDGRRRVSFADTMPLSTYLVGFIVGDLEMTAPIDVDGVPLRVVHLPARARSRAFAEECGAFAIKFFAEYFGIPYPSDKLDLHAIPEFRGRRDGGPRARDVPRGAAARRPEVADPSRGARDRERGLARDRAHVVR